VRLKQVVTVTVIFAATIAPITGVASADNAVSLGGGAGITVNGTACTLATIGHDNTGKLVGFTSSVCGGPGSPVTAASGGPVGSVVASETTLAYAVIAFDTAKVTPTSNFDGFAVNGTAPDPAFNQPACVHGADSGDTCGTIRAPTTTPGVLGAGLGSWNPGDKGEPITVDGHLVGVVRNGINMIAADEFRTIHHVDFALISAIMNDVNAKGGPGAGFTPIPA
jgi:hypothetical protein